MFSYHHKNTEKVAKVLSKVLDGEIKTPKQVNIEDLQKYNLIGFGSGIYGGKHHKDLLELANKIPEVTNKNTFIFSTNVAPEIARSENYNYGVLIKIT